MTSLTLMVMVMMMIFSASCSPLVTKRDYHVRLWWQSGDFKKKLSVSPDVKRKSCHLKQHCARFFPFKSLGKSQSFTLPSEESCLEGKVDFFRPRLRENFLQWREGIFWWFELYL
jgi:hypothetical protein